MIDMEMEKQLDRIADANYDKFCIDEGLTEFVCKNYRPIRDGFTEEESRAIFTLIMYVAIGDESVGGNRNQIYSKKIVQAIGAKRYDALKDVLFLKVKPTEYEPEEWTVNEDLMGLLLFYSRNHRPK